MKTPTPTEVKISALDEHRFASGQPDSRAFPDFHATKPSRVTRKQKRGWKPQLGPIALEMLGRIAFAITLLALLFGVPQ
jgi:hypothetical protein